MLWDNLYAPRTSEACRIENKSRVLHNTFMLSLCWVHSLLIFNWKRDIMSNVCNVTLSVFILHNSLVWSQVGFGWWSHGKWFVRQIFKIIFPLKFVPSFLPASSSFSLLSSLSLRDRGLSSYSSPSITRSKSWASPASSSRKISSSRDIIQYSIKDLSTIYHNYKILDWQYFAREH